MRLRSLGWVAVMWSAVASAAPSAADKLAAEALFDQGRRLMNEGKAPEACPKFAESHRLDPGVGVLLYLADCHEKSGKLASAWLTWREAAAAARVAGQPDREKLALQRASALESKFARIQIDVPAGNAVPGLVVTRDGAEVSSALWGVPVPTDPGEHVIEARAPGFRGWTKTITISNTPTTISTLIPRLEAEPTPGASAPPAVSSAPPAASAPPAPLPPRAPATEGGTSPQPTAVRALVLGARLGGILPVGQTGASSSGSSSSLSSLHGPGAALEIDAGLRLTPHLTGYAWFGYGLLSAGSGVGASSSARGADRQALGVGVQAATRHEGGVGIFGEAGVLLYHRYQLREETTGAAGACTSATTLAGNAVRLGGGAHVPLGGGVLLSPFMTAEIGRFARASYEGTGSCGLRSGDYGLDQRAFHASLTGGAAFSYEFGL